MVPVQSDEIRLIVQRILLEKFGPVILAATTGRILEVESTVPMNHDNHIESDNDRGSTEVTADEPVADQNLAGE